MTPTQTNSPNLGLESEFKSLLEFAPDGIIVINEAGTIVLVNNQTEKLFGYEKSELLGQPIEILVPEKFRRMHVHDRNGYFAQPTTRPMGAGRVLSGRRKDGSEFPAEISLSPVKTANGPLVTSTVRDVSERQRLMSEKDQVARDLDITRQAKEMLKNAVAVRDEFLSIASHELKTPLSVVALQLQLMKRGITQAAGSLTPEKWDHSLTLALKQVGSLTKMIEDLLDVSRMQNGRLVLSLERMDLASFLSELIERLRPNLVLGGVSIALKCDSPIVGTWDSRRLEQVLTNLLMNIVKHAPGSHAVVTARLKGDYAYITVEDDGPGIPEAKQDHIFERFERAVSDATIAGLGLGLFVVKRIVNAHQGTVDLQSKSGLGSMFSITLPLNGGQGAHPASVSPEHLETNLATGSSHDT